MNIREDLTEYGIQVVECYVERSRETVNSISSGDAFNDDSGDTILEVLLSQHERGDFTNEWQAMKNHVANGVYMTQADVAAKIIRLVTGKAIHLENKLQAHIKAKVDEAWAKSFWMGFATAGIIMITMVLGLFALIR